MGENNIIMEGITTKDAIEFVPLAGFILFTIATETGLTQMEILISFLLLATVVFASACIVCILWEGIKVILAKWPSISLRLNSLFAEMKSYHKNTILQQKPIVRNFSLQNTDKKLVPYKNNVNTVVDKNIKTAKWVEKELNKFRGKEALKKMKENIY